MADRSIRARASVVSFLLLALLVASTSGHAQQTTGQLLISSGFNPIPEKMWDRHLRRRGSIDPPAALRQLERLDVHGGRG